MGHECWLFKAVYFLLFYSGYIVFVENTVATKNFSSTVSGTELYESIATTKMPKSEIKTNVTMNNYHLVPSTSTIKSVSSKTSTDNIDHLKNILENRTWHSSAMVQTVLPNFTSHSKEKTQEAIHNISNPFVSTTVTNKKAPNTSDSSTKGLIISLVILFIIIIIISIIVILRKKKQKMSYSFDFKSKSADDAGIPLGSMKP